MSRETKNSRFLSLAAAKWPKMPNTPSRRTKFKRFLSLVPTSPKIKPTGYFVRIHEVKYSRKLDTILVSIIFEENRINMTVVSVRDFRANQGKYLDLAANGESVILTSRKGQFKITPITEDDSVVSKKEFFARVDEARKSLAEGKGVSVSGKEELDSLLASL